MTIEQLEELRLIAKKKVVTGIIITAIVCIISLILFKAFQPILFIAIIGSIITFITSSGPTRKFNLAFKEMFVKKSLVTVFTDLTFEPERGLDRSVIANTNMMYMGDRYSSNDYITGKYKNISVEQADVHIEEEHEYTDADGDTHTTWVTIFKGRWLVFDFNKTFKANLQVSEKGFGNNKVSNWGSKLKYQQVKMEDQEFNNQFRIYAQSDHEAFYILTPALMQKIKTLNDSINGCLLFCFIDNKLHVGLQNGKDSFEHSIFKAINEQEILENVSKDIKLITSFVDELDLDNDLFRRGV